MLIIVVGFWSLSKYRKCDKLEENLGGSNMIECCICKKPISNMVNSRKVSNSELCCHVTCHSHLLPHTFMSLERSIRVEILEEVDQELIRENS